MADLDWQPVPGLRFRSPLWVASAHFSDSENALRRWSSQRPAAITLKTTSQGKGGKGTGRRAMVLVNDGDLYTDGDPQRELLDNDSTRRLLDVARKHLPDTKLGVSVLLGEDFSAVASLLQEAPPDFLELNLKYSVRRSQGGTVDATALLDQQTNAILEGTAEFARIFAATPVFVKLSREIPWLGDTQEFGDLARLLAAHGRAGLLVANTERYTVSPTGAGRPTELAGGVLAGESLFDKTYHLLKAVRSVALKHSLPLIATGGIVDERRLLDALSAGASAVQLCTALQLHGMEYYSALERRLADLITNWRLPGYLALLERLHAGALILPAESPFDYHRTFYEYHFADFFSHQKHVVILNIYGRSWLRQGAFERLREFVSRSGVAASVILMSPTSAYLPLIAEMWGRAETEMREKMIDVRNMLRVVASHRHPNSALTVFEHNRCPFFSAYLNDDTALFVPYSLGRESASLPVLEFAFHSHEYARLRAQIDELRGFSLPVDLQRPESW